MIANEPLRDVVKKEVEWIWKPFIPLSKVTLIQGDTSVGKTNILIHIMALLSNGIYPPTMHKGYLEPMQHGEPVKIYYVTRENGIEDTYTPFFDDFKGNRDWVEYQKESRGHFVLTGDEIRDCVRITGAKLIVVDPWQGFLDGFISSNNKRVREMIDDVQSAAEETGAAVVLAGNYTKANAGDIMSGIGGSETFNTLRSILTVKYCDADESVRTIEASKMSFRGKEKTPVGIRQLDDDTLEFFDYKKWLQGDAPLSRSDEAMKFIRELLADGPVDSNIVKAEAEAAGISMSTINKIKKEARVVSHQQADRSSLWMLGR